MTSAHEQKNGSLLSVQYLRGIAALLVLVAHIPNDLPLALNRVIRGGVGVDLFFIISGFVMAVTIQKESQGPRAAVRFATRRFIRIFPLYAIATLCTAFVFYFLNSTHLDWRHIFLSITTIPLETSDGAYRDPVLFPGWSLSFESFFYVCLIGLLWLRKADVLPLALAFFALFIIGQISYPTTVFSSFVTAPIILEFVMGLVAFRVWNKWAMHLKARRKSLFILGSLLFLFALKGYDGDPFGVMPRMEVTFFGSRPVWRFLAWGVPSLIFFLGFISYEDRFVAKPLRFLGEIGDASYSLYLFHVPVIALLTPILGIQHYPMTFIYLLIPLLVSLVTYRWIEKPTMALGKTILGINKNSIANTDLTQSSGTKRPSISRNG
jgi:exopolysaccharide production protein ExoZ